MQFTRRRVLAVIAITWVPLLVLSILEGHAWGSGVALTFLKDVETHVRLLIAAPLLLYAEVRVHRGIPSIVREFVVTGLVTDAARPRFDAAIASALRLRNSVVAELLLLAFVYAVGIPFVWRDQVALDVNSWYATAADGRLHPFVAGWWAALVAMPVFQFLCLRWYFRMLIWARFMWQVSRIPLKLEPLHPDGTAGLHFLALSERAYRPVLLGLGTVLAGMMANRIFYAGAKLVDFKVEIVGTVALLTFAVLGPLLFFWQPAPRGAAQRNRALRTAGAALCARVPPQVDGRGTSPRGAAARQRRHPVARGSSQRLPRGRWPARGAVLHAEHHVARDCGPGSGGSAAADDILGRGAGGSPVAGALLRRA